MFEKSSFLNQIKTSLVRVSSFGRVFRRFRGVCYHQRLILELRSSACVCPPASVETHWWTHERRPVAVEHARVRHHCVRRRIAVLFVLQLRRWQAFALLFAALFKSFLFVGSSLPIILLAKANPRKRIRVKDCALI